MRYNLKSMFLACYDNDGSAAGGDDGAAAAAAAAAAANAGGGAGGGAGDGGKPVTSQAELNAALKREKENFRKEREKQAKQLEDFQKANKLTEEQNQILAAQI